MVLARKTFLKIGATGAAVAGFAAFARTVGGPGDLLRPPHVPDDAEFVGACLRCYRCIEVCPTGMLKAATIEQGLLNVRTPTVDFQRGICTFCNRCVDVCPTRAIIPCDPHSPDQGRIGIAVVHADRCLAYSGGCTQCVTACPYGALSFDADGNLKVDESLCNGCGICENVCPASVYRSYAAKGGRGITVMPYRQGSIDVERETGDGGADA